LSEGRSVFVPLDTTPNRGAGSEGVITCIGPDPGSAGLSNGELRVFLELDFVGVDERFSDDRRNFDANETVLRMVAILNPSSAFASSRAGQCRALCTSLITEESLHVAPHLDVTERAMPTQTHGS